jgi:predicted PurR-regulated permease PerM
VLFLPLHIKVEHGLKNGTAAAMGSILVIGLLILAPGAFLAKHMILEASHGAESLRRSIDLGEWRQAIQNSPRLVEIGSWIERTFDLRDAAGSLANRLTGVTGFFVKGSILQFAEICLTFYILFFLLRDRRKVLRALRELLPLDAEEWRLIVSRTVDTVHATIYGTLIASAVQGVLGGLMFWWLGLPAPLLWGVVMALLSVLRLVGAFLVWVPAAIFLAANGEWMRAAILVIWGMAVVGTIDNLLYPILVGNRLKLHTLLTFLSAFGGLIAFGASGFILGPISLSVSLGLIEIWRKRIERVPMARERRVSRHGSAPGKLIATSNDQL